MYKFRRQDTKEEFLIPFDWCDVTIKEYIGFYDIIKDLEGEELKENIFNNLDLFHSIISYWVGFDSTKLLYEDKIAIFTKLTFLFSDIQYTEMRGFSHKGIVYHLPESKKDYYGADMPFADATFSEIVECFELEKKMTFISSLPYILAVLCKPYGEEYNDQNVSQRSIEFQTLPMNHIWSICFFLISSRSLYRQTLRLYFGGLARRVDLTAMAGIMH